MKLSQALAAYLEENGQPSSTYDLVVGLAQWGWAFKPWMTLEQCMQQVARTLCRWENRKFTRHPGNRWTYKPPRKPRPSELQSIAKRS